MGSAAKNILITGSTSGIGAAAAHLFLKQGANVVLHGRNADALKSAISRIPKRHAHQVRGFTADLGNRDECRQLAAQSGDIDVLVNCAGVFVEALIQNTDSRIWNETISVNLTAAWILSKALLPVLRQRKGVIVNIGSDAAILGYPGCSAYCASKGALVGLTRALAIEAAPDVRVLCVCPGPTDTDMMRSSVALQADEAKVREQWASYTLLNRVAAPEEIAEAILFAASPKATFQTGSVILTDGGATAGRRV